MSTAQDTGRVFLDRQDPRKPDAKSSLHLIAQGSAFLNRARWVLIPGFTYESFADEPDTSGTGLGTLAVQTAMRFHFRHVLVRA